MRVILLILFILLIGQIVVNMYFYDKKLDKYDKPFMEELNRKMIEKYNFIIPEIFEEFEELFEKYDEERWGQGLGVAIISLFFIMFPCDAFLLIGVLLQTCRDCLKICRGVFSLVLLSLCFIISLFSLIESIKTKYKVDLSDNQIYVYDIEFNKKIKEKLNMMYERKIYMLAFSIFLTLSIIVQITLIIIDIQLFEKKKNKINDNNNNNTQPQIGVYQESERVINNIQNNGNGGIQVHVGQNIASTEEISAKIN